MSDVHLRIGLVRLQGADASVRDVRERDVRAALSAAIGSAVRARMVEQGNDARSDVIERVRVRLPRPVHGGSKGVADFAEAVAGAVGRSL